MILGLSTSYWKFLVYNLAYGLLRISGKRHHLLYFSICDFIMVLHIC